MGEKDCNRKENDISSVLFCLHFIRVMSLFVLNLLLSTILSLSYKDRIIGFINVLADEGLHIGRAINAGQSGIKHEFCNPDGCFDFDLKNIRLGRKQHSQPELPRCDLVCGRRWSHR